MCALAIIKTSHGEFRTNDDSCTLVQSGMLWSKVDVQSDCMRETTELSHHWCELKGIVPSGHCGCYFPPTHYVLPEQVKIEKPTTGTLPWRFEDVSAISMG